MIFTIFISVSQNEVTAFRRLQKTIHICESTSIPNFQKTILYGGADRNRTCDPLNANQVLSQLSYSPNIYRGISASGPAWTRTTDLILIRDAL